MEFLTWYFVALKGNVCIECFCMFSLLILLFYSICRDSHYYAKILFQFERYDRPIVPGRLGLLHAGSRDYSAEIAPRFPTPQDVCDVFVMRHIYVSLRVNRAVECFAQRAKHFPFSSALKTLSACRNSGRARIIIECRDEAGNIIATKGGCRIFESGGYVCMQISNPASNSRVQLPGMKW